MEATRKIFSLKQVAGSIQKTIAERYTQLYWVQAEMHKLNTTMKGHCYPELVEKEGNQIVAEMRGTIWKSNYDRILKQFISIAKEPLKDGMNLLFQVKISYHPVYGMGLEIVDIDPTYTLGALQKEREETLRRLAKEGIFNNNQNLPFPLLPQRIAIISVESSKGLSDFYSVINKNPWSYKFFFMLFVAQVNGDAAVASIMQQLKRIEKVKHHFDAVAIIRGGGGEIGLSCYNNFELSKAIATFPLPVLTGIGHSTNVTVSELVSYRNAITPTELADFLIQCFHGIAQPLAEWKESIRSHVNLALNIHSTRLKEEIRVFKNTSPQLLKAEKAVLSEHMKNTVQLSNYRFKTERSTFDVMKINTQRAYSNRKKQEMKYLQDTKFELNKKCKQHFFEAMQLLDDHKYFMQKELPKQSKNAAKALQQLEQHIRLVDPINVLKRGYALVLHQEKSISKDTQLHAGEMLEIRTFDFEIKANITDINKNKHE